METTPNTETTPGGSSGTSSGNLPGNPPGSTGATTPAPDKKPAKGKAPDRPKKPVGRPRKNIPVDTLSFAGIVSVPEAPENIIELTYNNAHIFKKITQLFKSYSAGEINMVFAPSGVFITGQDHMRHVQINVYVDGRAMNYYYCGEPTQLCSSLLNFNKSFGAIGKHHDKIVMRVSSARKTTLAISIHDSAHSTITTADITLNKMGPVSGSAPEYLYVASTWAWVLKFAIASKNFKSMVANIGPMPNFVRITKQISSPLCIESEGGRDIPVKNIYSDDNKLSLAQNLAPPNEIFSVSFSVDKIRPFANISLGKNISVVAHNGPQISFMTTMDERGVYRAVTIEILINIHGYRGSGPEAI